jgi:hypothetical protein
MFRSLTNRVRVRPREREGKLMEAFFSRFEIPVSNSTRNNKKFGPFLIFLEISAFLTPFLPTFTLNCE